MAADQAWDEQEYLQYLQSERARYAWVMRAYGGMTQAEADEAAQLRYPYEPPGTAFRGLIFHAEAWHLAMIELNGDSYWRHHPELASPPAAYEALG